MVAAEVEEVRDTVEAARDGAKLAAELDAGSAAVSPDVAAGGGARAAVQAW